MSRVLSELIGEVSAGRLRVVDLTQPLSPETPLLPLPGLPRPVCAVQAGTALSSRVRGGISNSVNVIRSGPGRSGESPEQFRQRLRQHGEVARATITFTEPKE